MFFPEGQVRVHVYGEPVDMRKSYDGLCVFQSKTSSDSTAIRALIPV